MRCSTGHVWTADYTHIASVTTALLVIGTQAMSGQMANSLHSAVTVTMPTMLATIVAALIGALHVHVASKADITTEHS